VLKKLAASGSIKKGNLTIAVITAAGLKTQEAVADVVRPFVIQPTVESFEEVLGERARA
jgi:threonine synthase